MQSSRIETSQEILWDRNDVIGVKMHSVDGNGPAICVVQKSEWETREGKAKALRMLRGMLAAGADRPRRVRA